MNSETVGALRNDIDRLAALAMPLVEANGNSYRIVSIEKVNNGFIVSVGCQRFVFEKWADLAAELGSYWLNPKKAEEKWLH